MKLSFFFCFLLISASCFGTAATAPTCTPDQFFNGTMNASCTNPNSGTTILCNSTDGVTAPVTNCQSGACNACTAGSLDSSPYTFSGYTVLMSVAGVQGDTDSTTVTSNYSPGPVGGTWKAPWGDYCELFPGMGGQTQQVTCVSQYWGAVWSLGRSAAGHSQFFAGDGTNSITVTDGYFNSTAPETVPAIISRGTPFITSGGLDETCTLLSPCTGGPTAGQFTTATVTSGSTVVTFAITAPNGWMCVASDKTHPTDIIVGTPTSTTTCTLTVASAITAGDVIAFSAIAY